MSLSKWVVCKDFGWWYQFRHKHVCKRNCHFCSHCSSVCLEKVFPLKWKELSFKIMSLSISLRTASYQLSLLYLWADKNDQPLKDCYEVIEIHKCNYRIKRLFIAVRELHSSVGLTRVRAYFVRSFTSFLLVSFLVYLFHFDATYEISWQRSFKLL